MAILELTGISKHFGAIQALVNVSLSMQPGEVVGLMGDNGAGKSTLVKIIAGKKVADPLYTGLDECTPDNIGACLAK